MNAPAPLLALAALAGAPFFLVPAAQEPAASAEAAADAAAALELEGRIMPSDGVELMPWPRAYSGAMVIREVVPHGTWVEQGQRVAALDDEQLERQLDAAERAVEHDEEDLHLLRERLALEHDGTAWSLEKAERALRNARRDLKAWQDFQREQNEAEQGLQAMYRKHGLEDQLDELRQLEAMYEDDELTDATEEIVLKRSRRNLERSRISAELQERRANFTREFEWQERGERLEQAVEEAERSLHQTVRRAELDEVGQRRRMEEAERKLEDARRKLEQLRDDAEQLALRAPRRGLLLHGSLDDIGQASAHEVGGQLAARRVAFSIVTPGRYHVAGELDPEQSERAHDGLTLSIDPSGPGETRHGTLEVADFPEPDGKLRFRVALDEAWNAVHPGSRVSLRSGD